MADEEHPEGFNAMSMQADEPAPEPTPAPDPIAAPQQDSGDVSDVAPSVSGEPEGAPLFPKLTPEEVDDANANVHPSIADEAPVVADDEDEPVLVPTEHAADPDALRANYDEAKANGTLPTAPTEPTEEMPEDDHVFLTAMVRRAYETMGSEFWVDSFGRLWSAAYTTVSNQAVIEVTATDQNNVRHTNVISASQLAISDEDAPDVAHGAVGSLHTLAH
jgi:hypothetical protein